MSANRDYVAKHIQEIKDMETQLEAWSEQLDGLVAGYLKSGAFSHDEYRLRVDGLRAQHGAMQSKINVYKKVPEPTGNWGAFQADIKDDWKALEEGLNELRE